MENSNPLVRLVVFAKLKKMMNDFVGKKIKPIERNMIRGLFIRNLKDYTEKVLTANENETILQKLTRFMKDDDEGAGNNSA
jgi:hypothetical protein